MGFYALKDIEKSDSHIPPDPYFKHLKSNDLATNKIVDNFNVCVVHHITEFPIKDMDGEINFRICCPYVECTCNPCPARCHEHSDDLQDLKDALPDHLKITEHLDGEDSWKELGIRFKYTDPETTGTSTVNMLNPLELKVCFEALKPVPLRDIVVWAWTDIYHSDNPNGYYKEVILPYEQGSRLWNDVGLTSYVFANTIYPSHQSEFKINFAIKFQQNIVWAKDQSEAPTITVSPPLDVNMWTNKANQTQITNNIYIGNYLAVLLAEEMGYDAVLNLDRGIEGILETEASSNIVRAFRHTNLEIGAGNEIPPDKITHLVQWLQRAVGSYKKILVGDKEGRGRAGAAVVCYLFANNPNLTFEEAYDFVRKRRFIYMHKNLKESLMLLYPRD